MQCPNCHNPVVGSPPFCASCGSPLALAAPADPLIGRVLHGKYKVVKILGEGGMGSVYLGEQQLGTTIRKVAIKTLHSHLSRDEGIRDRFQREVGTLAGLEHPNTVQVYDFGTTPEDQLLFIVMEFVQGKSLATIIDTEGALASDRVQKIVAQIGGSLAEAHGQGIIHRDLKPDNVIITDRAGQKDFVKVLDFGIAKRSDAADRKEKKLTQQGMVLGTPPYMSPEQFTGQPIDARSDIYSLAIMAYEMLTGKLPFEAATAFEWATLHMTAQPKPIELAPNGAALPDSMRGAIMKALAKAPDQRFATMNEFVERFTGRTQASPAELAQRNSTRGPVAPVALPTPSPASPYGPPPTPSPASPYGAPTPDPGSAQRGKTQMGEPLDFGAGGPGGGPPGGGPPAANPYGAAPRGGTSAGPAMMGPPMAAPAYQPPQQAYGAPPPQQAMIQPGPAHTGSSGGGGGSKGLIIGILGVVLVGSIIAVAFGTGAFKGSSPPPPPTLDLGTATTASLPTATATDTAPAPTETTPEPSATPLGGTPVPPGHEPRPHPTPHPTTPPPPAPTPHPTTPPPPAPTPHPTTPPAPTPTPPPAPTPTPPPAPTPTPPHNDPPICQQARQAQAQHMSQAIVNALDNQCRKAGGTP